MEREKLGAIILTLIVIIAIFAGMVKYKEKNEGKSKENALSFIDIQPQTHFYLYYDKENEKIIKMPMPKRDFPTKIDDAIKRAQKWQRTDLTRKFMELLQMQIKVDSQSFPAFADLDNDNDFDLTVGSENEIIYFKNIGVSISHKFFENKEIYSNITCGAPTFADLDGDGDFDLTIGKKDGTLRYYENVGNEWKQKEIYSGIDVENKAFPCLADMDSDGDYDLTIGTEGNENLFYYENIGTIKEARWKEDKSMYQSIADYGFCYPTLGDLDNDGDNDLLIGKDDGTLRYFINNGENSIPMLPHLWLEDALTFLHIDVGEYSSPTFVDLDNDSCLDMVIGNKNGTLFYFNNIGDPEEPKFLGTSSGLIYDSSAREGTAGNLIEEARGTFLGPAVLNIDRTLKRWEIHDAEIFADLILNAEERYVDEIAFVIAHTNINVLRVLTGSKILEETDPVIYNQTVILDNAKYIYENVMEIPYCNIIEKGNYTTLTYINGDNEEKELPRDIYYWYIVHPRCRFEVPCYYNNHFWRNYLFNDDSYNLSLKQVISNCTNVNEAICAITSWLESFMEFGYNTTDKHPTDIYDIHYGSCGEFSILTNAIGRTALIPTRLANDWGEDHVWNEFYDDCINGTWHHWDNTGPYINDPEIYERDWGKDISTVWSINGEDFIYPITEKYTLTGHVVVKVTDRENNPIDGVCVVIESDYFLEHTPWYWPVPALSIFNYTNTDGICTFDLGKNDYHIVIMSRVGKGIERDLHVEEGKEYNIEEILDGVMPKIKANTINLEKRDKEIKIEFVVEGIQYNTNVISYPTNDVVITGNKYPQISLSENKIDFFICDSENYLKYIAGYEFNCYEKLTASSGEIIFYLPDNMDFYFVFSNENSIETVKVLEIKVNGKSI